MNAEYDVHTVFMTKASRAGIAVVWVTEQWWPPVEVIDGRNASQTVKMEGAEVSLLSEIEAPSLAAVEQNAYDAFPIDCNFVVRSKISVPPDLRRQPGKRGGLIVYLTGQCLHTDTVMNLINVYPFTQVKNWSTFIYICLKPTKLYL